jgi:uncharacterized membrane protein YkvA (DUF1232 family)
MDPFTSLLAIAAVAVAAWLLLTTALWLHRPSRELVGPALRLLPDLVRLVRALAADPAAPRSVKLALLGLLAYLVNPIDLIPEFVPVLGPLDDVIVAGIVLRWAGRRLGREWVRAHWTGTPEGLATLERLL